MRNIREGLESQGNSKKEKKKKKESVVWQFISVYLSTWIEMKNEITEQTLWICAEE